MFVPLLLCCLLPPRVLLVLLLLSSPMLSLLLLPSASTSHQPFEGGVSAESAHHKSHGYFPSNAMPLRAVITLLLGALAASSLARVIKRQVVKSRWSTLLEVQNHCRML